MQERKLFDFTINVQGLVVSLVVAASAAIGIYFSVIKDVQALQSKSVEYSARFERIDRDMADQRADMKEKLNAIGDDVKEIRRYLLNNAAGERPDIKRWTR